MGTNYCIYEVRYILDILGLHVPSLLIQVDSTDRFFPGTFTKDKFRLEFIRQSLSLVMVGEPSHHISVRPFAVTSFNLVNQKIIYSFNIDQQAIRFVVGWQSGERFEQAIHINHNIAAPERFD
jgi:hypothetical protein